MRSDHLSPDSPGEWINRASSDLAIARTNIKDAYLEDLCYHDQQASEKALKSLLLYKIRRFPYTHDLSELLGLLEKSGIAVPDSIKDCAGMTEYAVEGRYPGFNEPLSEDDWKNSVEKAEEVVNWAKSQIPVNTLI